MFPNPNVPIASVKDDCVTITNEGGKSIQAEGSTATKYLQAFTTRHQPPATVFCARELEAGLVAFVENEAALLDDDEAIRSKARDILKTPRTAADDPVLLEKFKSMMRERLSLAGSSGIQTQTQPQPLVGQNQGTHGETQMSGMVTPGMELLMPSGMDFPFSSDIDLTMTDGELNDILQEIDFDFGDMSELPSPDVAALGALNQG